jgi:hypothetical protein
MRFAGLRLVKNSELDTCKSRTAKINYLKKIFIDAGFKEKITVASCKRFKLKRERAKEIAELDVNNIIDSGPRRTRNAAISNATPTVTQVKKR